tara:strand:- start:224 stop:706 length:483 start_codon:yes stop_codon:yes gene_type:complete
MKFLIFTLMVLSVIFQATRTKAQSYVKEATCLIEALYFEARGENFSGQLAVATVVLNRVKHSKYPNTICSVVHEGKYKESKPVKHKCAFSYYCDGKSETMIDLDAIASSEEVAYFVMQGGRIQGLETSLHYHATYVNPYWNRDFKRLMQIGNHIFYGDKK